MVTLTEIFDGLPYQSNLDGHNKKEVRMALERLEKLRPDQKEYWELSGEILSGLARNAMEQFARGKYSAGMRSRQMYEELFLELTMQREKKG